MEFQSGIFLVFFVMVLILYHALPTKAKPVVLLGANLLFYAVGGVQWVPLLVACIVFSWAVALWMDKIQNQKARLALLWVSVIGFVGLLFYFKYFSTLMRGILGYWQQILAPLGVSFFTFTILGYLIDVYWKAQPAEKNLVKYAVFVSMFAQISSGPIERAENMLPQLSQPKPYDYDRLACGFSRILWGFFKKFVLANKIGSMVAVVYGDVEGFSGPFLVLASLLYSYQLYLDFGGYSDIAIGIMQALGFDVMENFRRPFAARSYTQLWDRWHISLTSWFRDYVFTPISFSIRGVQGKAGKALGWLAIFIIFPLSGIWHGTGLGFLMWGVLNGIFMVIGKMTTKRRRKWAKKNPLYKNAFVKAFIQCGCVYLMFTACIVFFRAESIQQALQIYAGFFGGWVETLFSPATVVSGLKEMGIGRVAILLIGGGSVLVELAEYAAEKKEQSIGLWLHSLRAPLRWAAYYAQLLALAFYGVLGQSSFIYRQF